MSNSSLLQVGVSGLLASQTAITTTGHNISNANTDGYSRQVVELDAIPGQGSSSGFVGKGVQVDTVKRVVNQFLNTQVQVANSNYSRANTFNTLASQVNNLLAGSSSGLSPALTSFFSSLQDVANDPSATPQRQVALSNAGSLVASFQNLSSSLSNINSSLNQQLQSSVDSINSLASSIADLNKQIVVQQAQAAGQPPNDLLDKRDKAIKQLSSLVGVSTVQQSDGSINVSIGNGQSLVVGAQSMPLTVVPNPQDPSRSEIAYQSAIGTTIISGNLTGGSVGAVLAFRDQMLMPAQNALGRTAVALAETVNAQNHQGMDLNGQLGGDIFSVPSPTVVAASGNSGSLSVSFNPNDVGGLTTADYTLTYNGTSYTLTNLSNNTTQTLSGSGPFNVDGLTITPSGTPAAGDSYSIQPMRTAAQDIAVSMTDPSGIAAAAPVRSVASLSNVGNATISAGTVLDATNPNLLTTTTIVFDNPPTSYKLNGTGASIPYTSGGNIDVNGAQFQISGTPAAGDTFTIQSNSGGVGDNRNALLLAGLQNTKLLDGGTSTYQDAYGNLVSMVGAQTSQAQTTSDTMKTLSDQAVAAQQSVSGVNLDEEAASLVRFQQAYQASAKVITTADTIFQTLLQAVHG